MLPSVLACYFHHRLLLSPEHAEMVTDDMAAAEGLVWHGARRHDKAGHFLLQESSLCVNHPLLSTAFGGFECFID